MSKVTALYSETIDHLLLPLSEWMADDSVSEVMINGFEEIYIERGGKVEQVDARFESAEALEAAARNIAQFAGKRLTPDNPSIEARLPDGSRVHIVLPPSARKGICIAIRKFSKHKLDISKLIEFGALTDEAAEFLDISVKLAKNILVSGGTGSGKTTLLNCMSGMIYSSERILVLEDSSELQLQQPHVVPFEAQAPDRNGQGGISIRGLFQASLRMRPDRVIVGECRGGEALDMIQAMTSGHSGSMSTCHASSPLDAMRRIETMCLMADIDLPLTALRTQIASAVDLVVQVTRFHDGTRKITHISNVLPVGEDGQYRIRDIYTLTDDKNRSISEQILQHTEETPDFAHEPVLHGLGDAVKLTSECWRTIE